MAQKCPAVCYVILGVFGAVFLVANFCYNIVFNAVVLYKLQTMLALGPDSYSYQFWQHPPVPLYFQLYAFDIVNVDEIKQGKPPVVVEKGPYTYRVNLQKVNVTFNPNHTVTYYQTRTFYFDPELSVGNDSDTFTTLNAPLFTIATLLQYEYPWLQDAVHLLVEDLLEENVFITASVHQIFWGYEDRFLHLLKELLDALNMTSTLITGQFGFYMGKNGSSDGQYTVHTGMDDLSKFLTIDTWNGLKLLEFWSTETANMINGSDGALYPPLIDTDKQLHMFDSDLLRSMHMVYTYPSSIRDIPALKFVVEEREFYNASSNPDNAGFCTPLDHCIPSGLINGSAIAHGAPLYVSLPHFLGADSYYFNLVQGLQPDKDKHQPYFYLHQITGVCLSVGRRYQLNLRMKEFPFMRKTLGLPLAYVPVLWINGAAEIDDRVADMFQSQLEAPLKIVIICHYGLYPLASIMILVPFIYFTRRICRKKIKEQAASSSYKQIQQDDSSDENSPILRNHDQLYI